MARKLGVVVLLLLLVAVAGFAEFGVGLSVGYPVWVNLYADGGFPPETLMIGADLRWKPSIFMVDAGLMKWRADSLMISYVDAGLCLDLWILRFGLGAGVDVARYSPGPPYGTYSELGFNGKVNLDLKIGPVSVGANILVPVDVLLNAVQGIEPTEFLRMFSAQASVNVIYWFGAPSEDQK